ncbi:MAG TPA: radical SAM protein [Gemmatimonadaceae bacterium]|nr:radical SAM protein [Gemmatimonadaceae bacterium]
MRLPLVGEQADIRYLASAARNVLNGPEVTGMGFWSINPYVGCAFGCAYCYARFTHRYVMERVRDGFRLPASGFQQAGSGEREADGGVMPPWLAFERRIVVKLNAPEVLRQTLAGMKAARGRERWRRLVAETVVVGTATDPYQPAERRFRITRGVLEALAEHPGLGVTIITKSPLVTRDVDVLARIAAHGRMTVHVTITTIDRELARRIEPRAPTPEARLRAVARLREAGIDVGVNVMPILPGITDTPDLLDALVRRVAEAGATHLGACALRLQRAARERYLPFIEQEFPTLAARYRGAYGRSHQAGARYREGLRAFVSRLCARHGVRFGYRDPEDEAPRVGTEPAPPQLVLGL